MRSKRLAGWTAAGLLGSSAISLALSQGAAPPLMPSQPAQLIHGSPLIEVAARGDSKSIERHFATATPSQQYQALWWAVFHGHLEIARLLLEKGVKANPPGAKSSSALEAAARRPNVQAIALLCGNGADPNWRDGRGETPLHAAVSPMVVYEQPRYHGHTAVAKALLRCGADPRIPKPHGDQLIPVLHDAVRTGDRELVQMILDKGVDINAQSTGWPTTALMWAAAHPQVVELLLSRGADAKVRTSNGQSALVWAACQDFPELPLRVESIRLLLQAGARVNDTDPETGRTAMICAAGKASVEAVRLLAAAGADPNRVDAEAHTALGYVAIADSSGYSPFRDGDDRESLSQEQRKARLVPIVEILLAHGAKAELDPIVAEKARPDDPVGSALLKGLESSYVAKAKACIENRPKLTAVRAQESQPPSESKNDVFTPAAIVRLGHLPAAEANPPSDITISADGRRVYYVSSELSPGEDADIVVYDVTADTYQLIDADHSLVFDPAGPAGEDACMSRSRNGDPVLPGYRRNSTSGRSPEWAPVARIKYEIVPKGEDAKLAVVKGDRTEFLVHHDIERVDREWDAWEESLPWEFRLSMRAEKLKEMLKGRGKAVRYEAYDYTLSKTGRYLYYELKSTVGGDWFGPPSVRAHFVVDVLSRPVKVWELQAPMSSAAWHPNGRELFFIAGRPGNVGAEPTAVLAVARFP